MSLISEEESTVGIPADNRETEDMREATEVTLPSNDTQLSDNMQGDRSTSNKEKPKEQMVFKKKKKGKQLNKEMINVKMII